MARESRDVFQQPSAGTVTHDEPPPGIARGASQRAFFGHPVGLSTLLFTEMWERFSYYGIRPLLVLFMTAALAQGGFGFERTTASSIVGIYAACVYLASLPGGWIADRLLGLRRAIWYGGILIALGHLSIAMSIIFAHSAFFIGLIFIVLGTGLLKPNISAIVGDLYPEGGARRDAGFTIFYMGINLGAAIGPLVCSTLGEKFNWHYGFGAAGVGMVLGLVQFRLTRRHLGEAGLRPGQDKDLSPKQRGTLAGGIGAVLLLVGLGLSGVLKLNPGVLARGTTTFIVAVAILYF